jgi:hypothetical protein
MQTTPARSRAAHLGLWLAATTLALPPIGGCDKTSTEVNLNNSAVGATSGGIRGTRSASPLTPDEGRRLLVEIRRDPKRMQTLTIREREYLARAGVGAGRVDERRGKD